MTASPQDILLRTWFGPLDEDGLSDAAHAARWFRADPAFDEALRKRFGALHREVVEGRHEDWKETPRGRLAWVIAVDQLSRNLYRGTPRMYAWDPMALQAALEGLDRGDLSHLAPQEKVFLVMPLMHAEDPDIQDRCVATFQDLRDAATGRVREVMDRSLHFAKLHRDIVRRFGRFPHRNAILGRPSTPEELAFLQQPGSSF